MDDAALYRMACGCALTPISGAHFNPAVSIVHALRGELSWRDAGAYAACQIVGCCLGAVMAHAMFQMPLIQSSVHARTGFSQWLAEGVATFGLLLVVLGHRRSEQAPWMVSCWIGAAYWFTASTSFANPAITFARSLTDTFSGIRPIDVPGFVAAQIIGALLALPVARLLFTSRAPRSETSPYRDEPEACSEAAVGADRDERNSPYRPMAIQTRLRKADG